MRTRTLQGAEGRGAVAPTEGAAAKGEAQPAAAKPSVVPPGAWWNGIRRAWFIEGENGPELVQPQPPPPAGAVAVGPPPAVKVSS